MAQTGDLGKLGRRGEEGKDRIKLVLLQTIMIKLGILTGGKSMGEFRHNWPGEKLFLQSNQGR